MKYVIVNAVAAKEGGALSVLNTFIKNSDDSLEYILFIGILAVNFPIRSNIKYIEKINMMGFSRLCWDYFGLFLYIKKGNINVERIISLQNTAVNGMNNIPQKVYYHQAIPLSKYHWNPFKRKTRTLAFYKYIYPFFVRLLDHKHVIYIVQAEWIKNAFSLCFKIEPERIIVEKAKFKMDIVQHVKKELPLDKVHFFYPASDYMYKNHIVLIDALINIKKNEPDLLGRINFIFTLKEKSDIYQRAKLNNVDSYCSFLGPLHQNDVFSIYQNENVILVFPSVIETLGLPLLEANYFNCPIFVSDFPYSRETLGKFDDSVIYVKSDTSGCWANEIISYLKNN